MSINGDDGRVKSASVHGSVGTERQLDRGPRNADLTSRTLIMVAYIFLSMTLAVASIGLFLRAWSWAFSG